MSGISKNKIYKQLPKTFKATNHKYKIKNIKILNH